MHSGQRKARRRVKLAEIRFICPLTWCMAVRAVRRKLAAMNIRVTAEAGRIRRLERIVRVTGETGHAAMLADEREVGHRVVRERGVGLHLGPVVRRVTGLAIKS